jgi:ABC-type antimicrobial peptide transport system permease subunit
MTATLLDYLMILSLGILGGTGAGLLIGFFAGQQKHDWGALQKKNKITTVLLILACSATIAAILAWYIFWYPLA